jgi:hypothetical protein
VAAASYPPEGTGGGLTRTAFAKWTTAEPLLKLRNRGAVMLLQIFVDDERSVADWPFVRLLRTRKWLVLSALVAHLYGGNYVRWEALTAALGGVIVIRHEILWYAAVVPLALMSGQYLVNFYQAWLVRSETLRRRFDALNEATVAAAGKEVTEAHAALQSLLADPKHVKLLGRTGELQALRQKAMRPPRLGETDESVLTRHRAKEDHAAVAAALDAQNEAQNRVNRAIANDQFVSQFDFTRVRGYRLGEWSLDALRVLPTFGIAISAWIALFSN